MEDNVSFHVARPPHNHMATNNIIRHDVSVTEGDMRLTFPRCSGYTLQSNVLYATGSISFEGIANVRSWSKNLVYSGARKIEGTTRNEYVATGTVSGICADTLVADPLFLNIAQPDLRYRPNSPALKLGLLPLDAVTEKS